MISLLTPSLMVLCQRLGQGRARTCRDWEKERSRRHLTFVGIREFQSPEMDFIHKRGCGLMSPLFMFLSGSKEIGGLSEIPQISDQQQTGLIRGRLAGVENIRCECECECSKQSTSHDERNSTSLVAIVPHESSFGLDVLVVRQWQANDGQTRHSLLQVLHERHYE